MLCALGAVESYGEQERALDGVQDSAQWSSESPLGHAPLAQQREREQPLIEPLSERELEVLQLLAHGDYNQQIADRLVITRETVKRHVTHIFEKLGVKNRVQAVTRARTLGLLADEC
jgi:LuxR family maltose regulon positive regulatory protein